MLSLAVVSLSAATMQRRGLEDEDGGLADLGDILGDLIGEGEGEGEGGGLGDLADFIGEGMNGNGEGGGLLDSVYDSISDCAEGAKEGGDLSAICADPTSSLQCCGACGHDVCDWAQCKTEADANKPECVECGKCMASHSTYSPPSGGDDDKSIVIVAAVAGGVAVLALIAALIAYRVRSKRASVPKLSAPTRGI